MALETDYLASVETKVPDDFQRHLRQYKDRFATDLEEQAIWAIGDARSHRGFNVGCSMLGWNGSEYRVFVGANKKPDENIDTMCAEKSAWSKAFGAGFKTIIAITVAAPATRVDASRPPSNSLQPCDKCRAMFRDNPQGFKPYTRLKTIKVSFEKNGHIDDSDDYEEWNEEKNLSEIL